MRDKNLETTILMARWGDEDLPRRISKVENAADWTFSLVKRHYNAYWSIEVRKGKYNPSTHYPPLGEPSIVRLKLHDFYLDAYEYVGIPIPGKYAQFAEEIASRTEFLLGLSESTLGITCQA